MSDLPRRLRASLKFDAINGDRSERQVCGLQMAEAARTIDELTTRLAAAEADAEQWKGLALDLAIAAEPFCADQAGCDDPRVGLVQPVTRDEAEALSFSVRRCYAAIDQAQGDGDD